MTYEEFLEFLPSKCMYETIYDDSDGHPILVIRLLDAYGMVNKAVVSEPVAWADNGVVNWIADKQFMHEAPLYTSPQKRTWVGLTYEEQRELYKKHDMDGWGHFYNAIEAKLKEKNG